MSTVETTNKDTTFAPLSLTQNALKEVRNIIEAKELSADFGLRVAVEGGGCSGLSYVLGFDTKKEGDEEFEIEGVKVFMNKAHGLYLVGTQVDFQDGLNARGFTFSNPNATSNCGCGTSFGV